jgi:membrane protein required for beta-lactamase induction
LICQGSDEPYVEERKILAAETVRMTPSVSLKAAAQTVHISIMTAVVLWVVAVAVVLVYGARDLSRHPREVLNAASAESRESTASRVR